MAVCEPEADNPIMNTASGTDDSGVRRYGFWRCFFAAWRARLRRFIAEREGELVLSDPEWRGRIDARLAAGPVTDVRDLHPSLRP